MKLARQRACESECNSEMGSLPACILQQRCDTLASHARIRQASIAEVKSFRECPDDVESDDGCGTSLSDAEVGVATGAAAPVQLATSVDGVMAAVTTPNSETTPQQQARHVLAARLSNQLNGNAKPCHVGVTESMPVVNIANGMDGAGDTDRLMVNEKHGCKNSVAASERNISTQNPVR